MGKDKIKVLHVKHTKNIDILNAPVNEQSVEVKSGDKEPQFNSECIFNVKVISDIPLLGRFINRHRKREQALIYVDGKPFCEKLRSSNELIEPLTDEDRKKIVNKEIAKALGRFQMMKPFMFVIIVVLVIVVIVLQILILRGAGFA